MSTLFVTNLVAPDRRGAFAALHRRLGIELALFGGRSHHATEAVEDPGVPWRAVEQREVAGLAASGEWDAVVCGTAGRVALPGAAFGARRAGTPFVLWTALWAQPRSVAHAASAVLLRGLYRSADAVAVYGEHVGAHVRARGGPPRRVVVAPQAVDGGFWTAGAPVQRPLDRPARFAFVGRDAPGKGLDVLGEAWAHSGLAARGSTLQLAGVSEGWDGVEALGPLGPEEVRNFLGSVDVLVVPSVPTPTFLEPWGLVCNEAMHQGLPVISTDAVGAAAGGLVRHERNGLVVAAGDADALAGALVRLHADPSERDRLGAAARRDVAPYTYAAWAEGLSRAVRLAQEARLP